MPTTAYTDAAASFTRAVQWLVEIDLDRCDNDYTSAPCTASDAGDGSRCHYTFPTCQDPANFAKVTKTYRFCLRDTPWPDTATAVFPLLSDFVSIPQQIDARKLFTYPERISLKFYRDFTPPVTDADKALYNTSAVGEFWRNLFTRSRNYPGRPLRVKRGFNASGFVLADFEQVGPEYLITQVTYKNDMVVVEAESPLRELNKRQLPFEVSDDNVLTAAVDASVTTWAVTDGAEFPDPADYTRNDVYVECENEIARVTSKSGNNLTVVRGAFGTTAASHAISTEVKHVACFGTQAGLASNAVEVMQDLLEWAGVAAADVDTSAFDSLKAQFFPSDDTLRVVRRQKTIAKLIQQMREIRSIVLFMNASGQFSAAVLGPNLSSASLNDDSFLIDSVSVYEDDEERRTRVVVWYDPVEDNAEDPEDFAKAVAVVNAGLEGANYFNDTRQQTFLDLWLDPSFTLAKIRNLSRRLITRTGYGVRYVEFDLDVKDGTLNVGEMRTCQSKDITGINGEQIAMPVLVTEKKERSRAVNRYKGVDTNYSGRFFRIGPDTMTDDYDSATEEDKQYGYWGTATQNRVGTLSEEGYIKF